MVVDDLATHDGVDEAIFRSMNAVVACLRCASLATTALIVSKLVGNAERRVSVVAYSTTAMHGGGPMTSRPTVQK